MNEIDPHKLALVLAGLGVAAYAYERLVVTPLETQHSGHPFAAGLVIGGVLLTLAGATVLIGVTNALLVLAAFAVTGSVVTVSAARRYLDRRQSETTANTVDVMEQLGMLDE